MPVIFVLVLPDIWSDNYEGLEGKLENNSCFISVEINPTNKLREFECSGSRGFQENSFHVVLSAALTIY